MKKKCRILVVVSGSYGDDWDWLSRYFDEDEYEWHFCSLDTESTWEMLVRVFRVKERFRDYDIVISWGIGYCIAFAVALKLKLLGRRAARVKQIAYSFVQTRRLFKTRIGFINDIINGIFDRASVFVTHSMVERSILSAAHNLPIEKFYFSHWGYTLPEITPTEFSERTRPYVCCIGRNNRDFETFIRALEGLDVDGVIITSSYNMERLGIAESDQVEIHTDLDVNACWDCIQNSLANVLLVNHGDAGAGHITMVVSMLLGVPQVITDVATLRDYFVDGVHGRMVPIGAVERAREAIQELIDDPGLRQRYQEQSREYANRWLTEERAAQQLQYLIDRLMASEPFEGCDPLWKRAFAAVSRPA